LPVSRGEDMQVEEGATDDTEQLQQQICDVLDSEMQADPSPSSRDAASSQVQPSLWPLHLCCLYDYTNHSSRSGSVPTAIDRGGAIGVEARLPHSSGR
jgi:hypothetical protein